MAKIILVYITLTQRERTLSTVNNQLQAHMYNYTSSVQTKWDFDSLQSADKCCGVNGPLDWNNATLVVRWNTENVPDSCCFVLVKGCGEGKANSLTLDSTELSVHKKGCNKVLKDWLDDKIIRVGIISAISSFAEGFMVYFSRKWFAHIDLY